MKWTGGPLPAGANADDWTGIALSPNAQGNGDFVVTTSRPIDGLNAFNLTANFSEMALLDSPDGSLQWGWWAIYSTPPQIAPYLNIAWVTRVNTTGGKTPTSCAGASNTTQAVSNDTIIANVTATLYTNDTISVPFTASYFFYPCPEMPISDVDRGSPTSGVATSAHGLLENARFRRGRAVLAAAVALVVAVAAS